MLLLVKGNLRPELESRFSLCTPDWFGVLSAAPFLERRAGDPLFGICVQTDCQFLTVQSSGQEPPGHAALREGVWGLPPAAGVVALILRLSQTWPHVIPGCVGH